MELAMASSFSFVENWSTWDEIDFMFVFHGASCDVDKCVWAVTIEGGQGSSLRYGQMAACGLGVTMFDL